MPCRPDERFAQGPAQPKPVTVSNIILWNYTKMIFLFTAVIKWDLHQFTICLIAYNAVGFNAWKEQSRWPFAEFVAFTPFACFVINNYSRFLGRYILKEKIFEFSRLYHLFSLRRQDFEVCLEYTEIFFYSFLHWHNSTIYYWWFVAHWRIHRFKLQLPLTVAATSLPPSTVAAWG